jgi:D-glycero-alpha-D-manno-heptose 1-phosphate guanylyltransferase
MKAIILAGGKGTRLQSVINAVPKPMALIAGKPFLEYLILQLKSYSVHDIILSVGYKKESIISFFSNGSKWDVNISYISEKTPLGTGGAIQEAFRFIDDQHVLVMNGDSYINVNVSHYLNWHFTKNRIASIVVTKIDSTSRYGTVELDIEDRISKFTEKGERKGSGWINAGIYVFHRSIFENKLPIKFCSLEKEILPNLIEKEIYGYRCQGAFIDIGTPESYKQATSFFLRSEKGLSDGIQPLY